MFALGTQGRLPRAGRGRRGWLAGARRRDTVEESRGVPEGLGLGWSFRAQTQMRVTVMMRILY